MYNESHPSGGCAAVRTAQSACSRRSAGGPPAASARRAFDVRRFFFLFLILPVLFAAGCWGGQAEPEEEDGWYNTTVFKPLIGDYDRVEALHLLQSDESMRRLYEHGRYLTSAAACGSCHGSNPDDPTSPLAGGRLMQDRFGPVRAANITPDRETGIGGWSINEVGRAIRASINRSGKALSIDLHSGYRWLSDRDTNAIALFLLAQEAKPNSVDRRELSGLSRRKWGLVSQHRELEGYVPAPPEKETPQYGMYLANNVSGCARCHSPKYGNVGADELFTGAEGSGKSLIANVKELVQLITPEAQDTKEKQAEIRSLLSREGRKLYDEQIREEPTVMANVGANVSSIVRGWTSSEEDPRYPAPGPNIRGNDAQGLERWNVEQIMNYLVHGRTPAGAQIAGEKCPWPYFSNLSERDRRAIALYLKRI